MQQYIKARNYSYFNLVFSDISDHVNAVLLADAAYQLDFRSIQKDYFDLIYNRIRPEQVISLILSDESDTPTQSQLFFSRFHIEQLTQLQTVTLIKIESHSLKWIFLNLSKLKSLRSLTFLVTMTRKEYQNQIYNVQSLVHESFTKNIPRLHRIHMIDGMFLSSMPFAYLRHLHLEKCSINDLKTLFQHSTQLRSLSLCLNMHSSTSDLILFPVQLIRLHLKIEKKVISMNEMKYFLSNLPYLQHLCLELHGSQDLFDGYRWQNLTCNFITFNFKFKTQHHLNRNAIESYLTPFWLEEKHWYVGYNSYCIFSIPYFSPDELDMSQHTIFLSSAPDLTLLNRCVNKISLGENEFKFDGYFPSINTLQIRLPVSLSFLTSIIDLDQIKHLSLLSLHDILRYLPLEDAMPQLHELSICNRVDIDTINRIPNHRFVQIDKLKIFIYGQHSEYIIEKLIQLFPNINHLHCTLKCVPEQIMYRCINGFKYLSYASFYLSVCVFVNKNDWNENIKSLITDSFVKRDNFIWQVNHSATDELWLKVHWWFGKQVN
ncbi:unnamed protein product [Adineta steineri]|uniref:Uncharacterized protein n=2 Tax=Adineta steineri TaxID=433720 RepID=A0A813VEA9_9BILA|nr:unnamed protein product [Adineta steineri]